MRRYYMSIVDFSEIENITANAELNEKGQEFLKESGLLTEKGNPSNAQIALLSRETVEKFMYKLGKRMDRRPGGIESVYQTFLQLEKKKEYTAMYMYLAFLYGFIEWRVPRKISVLPANYDCLKVFFTQFNTDFAEWLKNKEVDAEG